MYSRNLRKRIVFMFFAIILFYFIAFNFQYKPHTQLLDENSLKLIKILSALNAILVDVDALNEIYDNTTYNTKYTNLDTRNFIVEWIFNREKTTTFAIIAENINDEGYLRTIRKYQLDCAETIVYAEHNSIHLNNKNVPASIYISCKSYTIHLAIFYKRGDYYWITQNMDTNTYRTKWFNDVPRAMNYIKSIKVHLTSVYLFKYGIQLPIDYRRFLYEYKHSVFHECDHGLAEYNQKHIAGYVQDSKKINSIKPILKYITKTLDDMYKECWLAAGTLLGWYRDCGVIIHTNDCDLYAWGDEYDDQIKNVFLGNKLVYLWAAYGLKDYGLEMRLGGNEFTFDLIFVYKYNETVQWDTLHGEKSYFKQFLPLAKNLCSAELFQSKYLVPCNPRDYLSIQYGNSWHTPEKINFERPMIRWNERIYWSENLVPYTLKYFFENGTFDEAETLKTINKFYNNETKHFSSLPFDVLNSF